MTSQLRNILPRALMALFFALCVIVPLPVAAQQGGTTRYLYDDNGRLRAVVSPTGEANVYEYDPAGNFTAIRRLKADDLEVLDFSPRAGVPGDRVTFTGVGFGTGVSAVSFNGVTARIITVNAPTLVAEVPPGATTGPVTIITPRGTAMTPAPFTVRGIRVNPSAVRAVSGETVQFAATVVLDGDQSVRWSVNGVEGGNSSVGTVSPDGVYTAPRLAFSVPSSNFFVRATSNAVPPVFGEARVTVRNPEFVRSAFAQAVSVRNGNTSTIAAISAGVSVNRGIITTAVAPVASAVSVRNGNISTIAPVASAISVRNGNISSVPALSANVSVTTAPSITVVSPDRVPRGATVTVTINGKNLSGVTGVQFIADNGAIDASIAASNLTVSVDGTSLTVTVTVSSNAALGRRLVIVSTLTSHSLSVDAGSNAIEIVQ